MFDIPSHLPLTFTNSKGVYREIFSPSNGKLITKVQEANEEDVELILKESSSVQQSMEGLRPYERASILKEVGRQIELDRDELAYMIALEGGKPLKDARVEVERARGTMELCAEEALRLNGEVIPMERTPAGKDHLSFTIRSPIGRVLAISAFNHPLNLISHQVGCAVASGCSVVLKPSPATPLCAYYLHNAFLKAGLFSEGIRIIMADIPLIRKLATSSAFDYVSFIGASRVGWELRRIIPEGVRLGLELGGVAPAIVSEEADLDLAARALVKGSFYHAGQACISTQKIYVHEKVEKAFLEKFKTLTEALITGPATEEKTDVGPLIRANEVQRIISWIQEAVELGGKVVCGNKVFGEFSQFLSPTILLQVPLSATIMKEEVFGPVVCVNSFFDSEKLLRELNQSPYVFESALFTKNLEEAFYWAKNLSTMTLVINNHTAYRVDQMPFGGHKKSGLGLGGVKYSMEEMTRLKQIIVKT